LGKKKRKGQVKNEFKKGHESIVALGATALLRIRKKKKGHG
jgi:hypothetical protein